MSAQAAPRINDKREIFGWYMYDWAISAFSTTVGTVFLGPYLAALARAAADASGMVYVLGVPIAPGSFLPYCISISVGMQAMFLPMLGAAADFSNQRKNMLMFFAVLGGVATTLLYFVQGSLWWLGGLLYVIANLSFGAAIVFYNAFLPEIASPDQRDRVSTNGWGIGYLGGGLLLLLNLILYTFSDQILGPDSGGLAVRINLGSAGIWWLG
ncbi:MAG: MFS transporter, partial [Chloroflexi bacterium]